MSQSSIEHSPLRDMFMVPVTIDELKSLVSDRIHRNELIEMLIRFKVKVREENGEVFMYLRDIPLALLVNCATLHTYYRGEKSIYELALDLTMDRVDIRRWIKRNVQRTIQKVQIRSN